MKNEFGKFGVFFFLIFGCCGAFGQVVPSLEYEDKGSGMVEFTIDELVDLPSNIDKFNSAAYYQAFVMHGDGNFEKVELVKNGDSYIYRYRDIENNYPAAVLMIARKDDGEEPPDPTEMIIIPNNNSSTDSTGVNVVSSNKNTGVSIVSNTAVSGSPLIPMITETGFSKLAIGLSHYFKGGDTYFMEPKTVHAIPIAYKPTDEGVLLFFYKRGANTVAEFEYYNGIPVRRPLSEDYNTGTLLSNYYQPVSNPRVNVFEEMDSITKSPTDKPNYLADNGIKLENTLNYDQWVAHFISKNEVDLLVNEVVPPSGSSSNKGELRLFHFIKTNEFEDTDNAQFLVILYERADFANFDNLFALNNLVGDPSNEPPFPSMLEIDSFKFVDYALLEARKGEPDDPGGLIIEGVSPYQDDYEVTFKLTFCNSENAADSAVGANIFLESYPVDIPPSTEPYLRDIEILSSCVDSWNADITLTCSKIEDSACEGEKSPNIVYHDAVTCYDFNPGKLAPGACGVIHFVAKMSATEVGRLVNEPVMRYCVKFHDGMEVGEFCRPNDIIQDTICYIDTTAVNYDPNSPTIVCEPNPILEDVIPTSNCSCGCYNLAWIWTGILASFFALSCCFFLFKRRKKEKHRKYKKDN